MRLAWSYKSAETKLSERCFSYRLFIAGQRRCTLVWENASPLREYSQPGTEAGKATNVAALWEFLFGLFGWRDTKFCCEGIATELLADYSGRNVYFFWQKRLARLC